MSVSDRRTPLTDLLDERYAIEKKMADAIGEAYAVISNPDSRAYQRLHQMLRLAMILPVMKTDYDNVSDLIHKATE